MEIPFKKYPTILAALQAETYVKGLSDDGAREESSWVLEQVLKKSPHARGAVLFVCLDMSSSNFGSYAWLPYSPDNTLKRAEDAKNQHIGEVPSQFRYAVAWVDFPEPREYPLLADILALIDPNYEQSAAKVLAGYGHRKLPIYGKITGAGGASPRGLLVAANYATGAWLTVAWGADEGLKTPQDPAEVIAHPRLGTLKVLGWITFKDK